ncbi:F-box/WD-40 repeat-containing protein [Tripterygium wilfordii]|uniref:F-box/WD-40 repeat-containing protein n=1 Tax=Tripterygium wilfordii TaxID=458696 RepID=A0A7J7DZG9_TRIWF|nr:F-box/WD-40 repeat-containing protein At5g21040 [Tripterygium wilfordii]KAF5751661.1 F-box/WD-40 repeat-containing protein [Tripterygium wilfordii]
MAFECQEGTEVSKNLKNCEKDSCQEQIEAHQIIISKGTLDSYHKNCITSSYTAKQSPCNNVLSGCHQSITDLPPALISEILNCLDPKELGIVSCVSPILYRLASEHQVWKEFYSERWGLPIVPTPLGAGFSDKKSWKELFVEREFRSKTFLGRYSIDALHGHTEAVRTVFLLASAKLVFTSGYDSVVRMWDMEEGLSIASSRPLGCTIRAVAADTKLLIAGVTEGFIHCWRAVEGLPCLFDLRGAEAQNTEFRLWEHEGPITSLALDLTRIYSGSWDMAVRVWDRASLKCLKVLRHGDWVWGLAPHDTTVASAAGSDVYVWETKKGIPLGVIHNAHVGNIYSLARSHTGEFIFTGGEDGAIHMFEMTSHCVDADIVLVATWIPHSGPVYSLAFEFPWLVSASSDGKMSLIDVRKLLRTRRRALGKNASRVKHVNPNSLEPPQRMLHGFGANLFSVDIGADRIICGGEEGVVRIWNFSQALEIEQRARTLRGRRLENRMRRRKLQIDMNSKGGQTDQCSVAAKKKSMHGDRSAWHHKRGISSKLKA